MIYYARKTFNYMNDLLYTLFNLIIWVFVPFMLILIIQYCMKMSKRLEDAHHKMATKSGFWAGFMLFIIIMVYQVSFFIKYGFPNADIYQGFSLLITLLGAIIGFGVSSGGRKILPPKLTGWIIMSLTFVSFSTLFHYLFIHTYNEVFLSLILGVAFGVFAHFAASPSSLREFLKS